MEEKISHREELVDESIDVTENEIESFSKEGFVILEKAILKESQKMIEIFQEELQMILDGEYPTKIAPDKVPNKKKLQNKKKTTLQIINVWKSSNNFKNLVNSSIIGKIVSKLAGWKCGARLAQDQVWIKPPNSGV